MSTIVAQLWGCGPILPFVCALWGMSPQSGNPARLPGIGESIVISEIKVTLLGAKRLSLEEYLQASRGQSAEWAGGGLRIVFLTENRPGATLPPGLGEIRVLFGSQLYNPITNAASSKPLSPGVMIRDSNDFLSTSYGRELSGRAPVPRAGTVHGILDVFVRGGPVPAGTSGIVELEQGETHRPDSQGRLRQLDPGEMGSTWTWFRFRLPSLD